MMTFLEQLHDPETFEIGRIRPSIVGEAWDDREQSIKGALVGNLINYYKRGAIKSCDVPFGAFRRHEAGYQLVLPTHHRHKEYPWVVHRNLSLLSLPLELPCLAWLCGLSPTIHHRSRPVWHFPH
jgi:hypothetical protein